MDYEIVEIQEKIVVGITAQTCNSDSDMPQIIGGLWERFFNEGIFSTIESRKNENIIGLYSNYETDVNGIYSVTVCYEVDKIDNLPNGVISRNIPAGKYARFRVFGHVQTSVADFWNKFWKLNLDRRYSSDFEEYQSGGDMENTEVHIYIAIN